MAASLHPLQFEPVYKDYIWGGRRLREVFRRDVPFAICAESWEIADRPEGTSVVARGALRGATLPALMQRFGPALAGPAWPAPPFPLLIKILDAAENLSVQVHPDDASARRFGGEAKSEMWYILGATPDARLYCGLKPGTQRATFEDALREGRVQDLLNVIPVTAGDAVYVPGGTAHAIGAGCLLLEVQQNSNTTYRLHDWDRLGPDGKPRELHTDRALATIDWAQKTPSKIIPGGVSASGRNRHQRVIRTAYFGMEHLTLQEPFAADTHGRSFHALFACEGDVVVDAGAYSADVPYGTSCLMPAACGAYRIAPRHARARVLRVSP